MGIGRQSLKKLHRIVVARQQGHAIEQDVATIHWRHVYGQVHGVRKFEIALEIGVNVRRPFSDKLFDLIEFILTRTQRLNAPVVAPTFNVPQYFRTHFGVCLIDDIADPVWVERATQMRGVALREACSEGLAVHEIAEEIVTVCEVV